MKFGSLPAAVRYPVLALAVFGVGVAGVLVGTGIRSFFSGGQTPFVISEATRSLLTVGQAFPDVEVTLADGVTRKTSELIGSEGCVFLFLDLECHPCEAMSDRWQAILESGAIEGLTVVGITNHAREAIRAYCEDHSVTFPVAEDPGRVFLHEFRVQRFPLQVVVGSSGEIRSTSYYLEEDVDPHALMEDLAG